MSSAAEGKNPPVVIGVAPNGARLGKADHPRLPCSRDEIVECCAACVAEGATFLHLHVRDADGRHVLDAEESRRLACAASVAVGGRALVQTTTEAFGLYSAREQLAFLRAAKPRAASLAWREFTRDDLPESELAALLAWCGRERVALQYILYDRDDALALKRGIARGIVPEDLPHLLFVVGRYGGGSVAGPSVLDEMRAEAPGSPWMVCAFGAAGHAVLDRAVFAGGHVRIGFENGTVLRSGKTADSNAALVAEMRQALAAQGRRPATAAETAELF